jgi:hypothetical protein
MRAVTTAAVHSYARWAHQVKEGNFKGQYTAQQGPYSFLDMLQAQIHVHKQTTSTIEMYMLSCR